MDIFFFFYKTASLAGAKIPLETGMIIRYSVIHVPTANELICTFLIVATTYSSRIETSLNTLILLKTNFENQIHCNLSIFS